ncbi:MAG TPA: histidinol-phosphate transaminase [Acidimicrobiia bacterium]|nr:histidinol-phosphate transaminase [Acidimicrobiia bacterium]
MVRYREDIAALSPYEVGAPIEEVARRYGLDPSAIIRLTANESPEGPFPGVAEAVTKILGESHRYPDPDVWDLGHALAGELGVDRSNLLFGAGSVALLAEIAQTLGGPGTTAVYPWPSFVLYRFVSIWAMTRSVEAPLDERFAVDLEAMRRAVDESTRVVYLCNPNNPTGTVRSGDEIQAFIEDIPERVLVVVDEAYHEFVTDPSHRSMIPTALERPNVVVLRTFSKIYALAAHRIGYAVGTEPTLTEIRKAQAPLTVNQVAQAAALASLGQPEELRRRVEANAAARHQMLGVMAERGIAHADSQTNFIYFRLGEDSRGTVDEFTQRGVIIRPMSRGWVRVTIGSEAENRRFVEVLDEVQTASA